MRNVLTVMRRELGAYLLSPMGYVIAAVVLLIDGLLFNGYALGAGARLSAQVLQDFFYFSSGTTMVAAVLLAMPLFAEERQTGTIVLLRTAPVSDWEVVLGKFLAALVFLSAMTLATLYMPLLVMVHGKVAPGHLVVGYVGLLCLGSASLAVGLLGSVVARTQVVAVVLGTGMLVAMLTCWFLAKIADPPLPAVFEALSLHNLHFRPFMQGTLHLRDLVYYAAVTYFFLLVSVRVLAARRWT